MSPKLLYRIAALVLLLFAIGHTVGFLAFKPESPEGLAVLEGMKNVRFQVGSTHATYMTFFTGFGLFATLYLLFATFLSWQLGSLATSTPRAIVALAWAFFVLHLVSTVLCWIYFLPPPIVLSAIATVCTGCAAWLVQRTS